MKRIFIFALVLAALTSVGQKPDLKFAHLTGEQEAGMDDYISKPITLEWPGKTLEKWEKLLKENNSMVL